MKSTKAENLISSTCEFLDALDTLKPTLLIQKKLDDRSRTLVHLGTEPGSK